MHASLAKILHLSDAGEAIDTFLRDLEIIGCLAEDRDPELMKLTILTKLVVV